MARNCGRFGRGLVRKINGESDMRFIIHAETPSKKNSRITLKSGRTIPNKKFMQWHKEAMAEIAPQLLLMRDFAKVDYPVKIVCEFVHGENIRRDSDNQLSSILDLLQDCGILEDDCWKICRELEVKNSFVKNNAMAIIEIKKMEENA